MVRKVVDPALMKNLVSEAANQVVTSGSPKSDSPDFPVFRTPLDKDIIVYFPKNCTVTTVDGQEVYDPLVAHVHTAKKGKQFLSYRCISNFSGGTFTDVYGYDGECPFCNAVATSWELYNAKMARKAQELGINLESDTTDQMKPYRQQFLEEMAIKRAEEYVTFPIVVISETGLIPETVDTADMKAYFVTMRKSSFVEKIIEPLTKQAIPIAHPGGMFFKWCYTYDTKGKPANLRDAGKNAKYLPVIDANSNNLLSSFIAPAEELAKNFTKENAASFIVMNEFYEKSEIVKECDAIMAETNRALAVLSGAPVASPTVAQIPQMGAGVAGALASFGVQTPAEAPATAVPNNAPVTAVPHAPTATVPQQFAGFGN